MSWDPRRILAVEPDGTGQLGYEWTCSRCGDEFDSAASWSVLYRTTPDDHYRFVVCPSCADLLRPRRLVILDLATLEAEADGPLARLAEEVRRIARMRGVDEDRVVLRSVDTQRLASELGIPAAELAARLYDPGVVEVDS